MNKIEGLLKWCKYHTDGYPNVSVTNFTSSWKNGLAFNALIHRFKPELIDFHHLDPDNEYYNNYLAFKVAESHFGIPSLLDPKDMALAPFPEKLSVITYVSQFHNCLKEMEPMGGPRINMFENTSNLNSDWESMSSRSSLCKLAEMKCSICRNKVYILERYVAEDKLYHRKCYREFQIQNIDKDSDVIGDYLNIYGELKPSMNKEIFVHPLQGIKEDKKYEPLVTNHALNLTEEALSDSEISGQYEDDESESLSSFSSDVSEQCKNGNVMNTGADAEDGTSARVTDVRDNTDIAISCQENLVLNILKGASLKPIKTRLYIKKKDKGLPYSTFFEVSDNMYSKSYLDYLDNQQDRTTDVENTVNMIEATHNDDKIDGVAEVSPDNRKLLVLKTDEEIESDLSSIEEDQPEIVEPSLVRNSIWRKPIICSTSVRKYHSVSVPIETKYKCYSEFKERLADLNMKQSQIEIKGRKIQQRLWEEDPTTPEYEDLLITWLELVEEKDKIFYEENALYSWLKDVKLQEMKDRIEFQIRLLSNEDKRNENANEIEKELIAKLIETVNKRSELVDAMHEENLKRLKTIQFRHDAIEKIAPLKDKELERVSSMQSETGKKKIRFWKRKSSQL